MLLIFYAVLLFFSIRLLLIWIKNLKSNAVRAQQEKEKVVTKMGLAEFWKIVEESKKHPGNEKENLKTELRKLDPRQIVEFQNRLNALKNKLYHWDLWGAVYLWCGGCSDDSFEYFREWLIVQGKDKFDSVLKNPETIADFVSSNDNWEGFGYCPGEVYKEKTKKTFFPSDTNTKDESTGSEWHENELPTLFPVIWKKLNEGKAGTY